MAWGLIFIECMLDSPSKEDNLLRTNNRGGDNKGALCFMVMKRS